MSRTDPDEVVLRWCGELSLPGWWDSIRPHSFGWVTARDRDGLLAGFVNVVSDGCDHAFLIDTKPHLRPFYFGACGFEPTDAGLIHLSSL